ncbi:MAG: sigma-54 interaction domain-containing protein [bacterium]
MGNSQKSLNRFEAEIIGKSPQIRKVIATAKKIAKSSSITTLIIGESGTGKDLVARLIHNLSTSANQPFVDINCGAIPENLLESELFGHEKGAFTGAHMRKPGLFELANGGTIFLDEIGNTTPSFQIKLLKAVENKRFRRINGVEEIRVSTRIIAATNLDLRNAVQAGRFRKDLYYRLNVCQIYVPPLRERGEDVLILSHYFIDCFNREYHRAVQGLAPPAVEFIQKYPWPGNVRQLKNAIERAVLVECDQWIEAEHLLLDSEWDRQKPLQGTEHSSQKVTQVQTDFSRFEIPAEGIPLEEIERNIILSALERSNGNISQAARLLKINRGKLRYRMERLGVTPRNIHELRARAFN